MGKCVVIGNGVTGRAAAHAARKMHNEVDIYGTLGTRDASTGSSRVLRCDYGSVKMSNHATIVYSVWISLYPQLVILCGRIIIYPPEQRYILTAIDRTRVKLGKGECPTMTAKEAQDAIGAKVDFERKFRKGTIYVLVKEDCVLDWNGFMDLMGQPQDGIVSRDEEVTGLDIGFGKVTRVRTKTGSFALKQNDTVILASGGRTEDNMERWVVPKLPESHQPFAVVIISYEVKLGDEELAKVKDMRIISVIGSYEITPPVKGILKITWLEHRFLEKGSGLLSNPEILDGSAILRVVTLRVKENLREMLDIKDVELPVFKIEPQIDSQSKAGVPIFARYPGFENLMFCGNLNLTGAKFGPVISGFVENGLAGRPDFGFEKELDTHSQPALLTDKTFQEVEEGATKELETLEREEAL